MKKHKYQRKTESKANAKIKSKAKPKRLTKKQKTIIILIGVFLFTAISVGTCLALFMKRPEEVAEEPAPPEETIEDIKYYSKLTGEEIPRGADEAPLYCMQIPNGLDGARPQIGLRQAKVVFEAIAEAGITRFAAIFQNPEGSMLGPIRSLRTYYLDWDTPFGCTVVHAGGSDEAIAALHTGGYREVDEDYNYAWRDYSAYIAPNNLFTSPSLLAKNSTDYNYGKAEYTAWPRLLPDEAQKQVEDIHKPKDATKAETEADNAEVIADESETATVEMPIVNEISLSYGSVADFNPLYTYDPETNSYLRSYASGAPHQTYDCPSDLTEPNVVRDCTIGQVQPKVVIAMKVSEWLDTDGYHHVINTTSSGEAVVFQNGTAIPATWKKASRDSQITFTDQNGNEIKLTPGQTWISALPNTGAILY